MNIRYVEGIEDLAPLLHLRLASFHRDQEPPDLIGDRGEVGKEAMLHILGENPMRVAEKALAIKNALQVAGRL